MEDNIRGNLIKYNMLMSVKIIQYIMALLYITTVKCTTDICYKHELHTVYHAQIKTA